MSVQFKIEHKENWLVAHMTGKADTRDIPKRYAELADLCEQSGKIKIIVDITGSYVPQSTYDKFEMGEHAIIFTLRHIQVAVLAKVEQIDPQRFGESVAKTRGANLRLFTDMDSAEEWLRKG